MDRQTFVEDLLRAVPEAQATVAEHLSDMDGELLLHLLLFNLTRLTGSAYGSGNLEVAGRILRVVARGLEEGVAYVANAVAVSFVEDFAAGPGEINDDLLGLHSLEALRDSPRMDAKSVGRRPR